MNSEARENTPDRKIKTERGYKLLQEIEARAKELSVVVSTPAPDVREFPQRMHVTDWHAACTWIKEQIAHAMKIANRAMLSEDTAAHAAALGNFREFATGVGGIICQIQRELGEV